MVVLRSLLGVLWMFGLVDQASAQTAAEGHAWLAAEVERFNRAVSSGAPRPLSAHLVDDVLHLDLLTSRTFRNYCAGTLDDYEDVIPDEELHQLLADCRSGVLSAFRDRLLRDLSAELGQGLGELGVRDSDFDVSRGRLTLASVLGQGPEIVLHARRSSGRWGVEDVSLNSTRISETYRARHSKAIEREMSFEVLRSELEGRDYVVVDDFSNSSPGELPKGWRWRKRDEKKDKPYEVQVQGNHHVLAARDTGKSVILLKSSHWDPHEFPIMTWCWRADTLPPGGDERFGHTNDSAAGLYIIFSQNWLGLPRQIKYVWSTTLPEGTMERRKKWARPYFFVEESGYEHRGEWRFEMVDLIENYQRAYNGRPKNRTLGIGVLTDANSTDSSAEASYADIRVWPRRALQEKRIVDHCQCLNAAKNGQSKDAGTVSGSDTSGPLRTVR
ncbi:MAG: DUF3047 domain-containing protein [Candidatus Latescibacterota bacterium]|nr:DUF3047 domain-containing protein [Candidatus Latescibacterota bacterium]